MKRTMRSSHALSAGNSSISMPAQPADEIQPQCEMSVGICELGEGEAHVVVGWVAAGAALTTNLLWCTYYPRGKSFPKTNACRERRRGGGFRSDSG